MSDIGKNILGMQHPHDVIQTLAINRKPRMPGLTQNLQHGCKAAPGFDPDNFGPRQHDVSDASLRQIENTMQAGASDGMCTMDGSLKRLVDSGTISGMEAYLQAIDKRKFEEYQDLD